MSSQPLAGTLVTDLTRHLPGPLTTRILRDLGARVIKVEEPTLGDPVRRAPPFARGRSALAAQLLGGVESIALDLKIREAREVLERILERADVLVESFRPGSLARMGLAPLELRRRHPRLIICSLSGWGQEGPSSGRAGHDLTYQAVAGLLAPTGQMPALPAADLLGAWGAVSAVLAALVERSATGEGEWIDTSLLDAAVYANLAAWAAETGGRKKVGDRLALTGGLPCYGLYRARDGGLVALAALEPHFWERLCRRLGRDDLRRLQYRRDERSRRRVAALIASRSSAEWQEVFTAHDIPGERVLSAGEAAGHPQVRERELLERDADGFLRAAFPARLGGERPWPAGRAPALGAQTGLILAEFAPDRAAGSRKLLRSRGIGPRPALQRLWRSLAGGKPR